MENIFQLTLLLIMGISSTLVLLSKNPVHSVLFLILVFLCAACDMLYIGAEFIAIMFIIVYVGAIAVLFLFIVMMLDIKQIKLKKTMLQYVPLGILFSTLCILEIYLSIDDFFSQGSFDVYNSNWYSIIDKISNTELIGQVLYQEYVFCFLLCGVVLLIAMVGAIALTQTFSSVRTNELTMKQLSRGDNVFFLFKN